MIPITYNIVNSEQCNDQISTLVYLHGTELNVVNTDALTTTNLCYRELGAGVGGAY